MVETTDFKFSREKHINRKNDINVRERNEEMKRMHRRKEWYNTNYIYRGIGYGNVQYYWRYARKFTDYPKDRERAIYKYIVDYHHYFGLKHNKHANNKGKNKAKYTHGYNKFSIGHNYINNIAKMDCKNSDFHIK